MCTMDWLPELQNPNSELQEFQSSGSLEFSIQGSRAAVDFGAGGIDHTIRSYIDIVFQVRYYPRMPLYVLLLWVIIGIIVAV